VDQYHIKAGSKNFIEMHGGLLETRCTKCGNIEQNFEKLIDSQTTEKLPTESLPLYLSNFYDLNYFN
jgi:NAD-dependent SIR2 family protein deacetylase